MLGAIIGDIAGSRFEWNNHRSKEFDLFGNDDIAREACFRTDDSVMTIAVADAIMKIGTDDEPAFKEELIDSMHKFGRADMDAGYGESSKPVADIFTGGFYIKKGSHTTASATAVQ